MTYKPVGIDEDSKFPPRVEARLQEEFGQEFDPDTINWGERVDAEFESGHPARITTDSLYQAKDTVADQAVADRLRGVSLSNPTNNPTQMELNRQLSKRWMNNISVRQMTRVDSESVRYYYTAIRQESYGRRLPGAVRHEYAANYQDSWTPGTPGIPTPESIYAVASRKKAVIVTSGSGISQGGGDIGQIAGASWRDGVMYQGMSVSHVKNMECIGFDIDGVARIYSLIDGDTDADMSDDQVQDAWGFGPYLIKNGVARNLSAVAQWSSADVWMTQRSARLIFGQSSNGSNIILAVEGTTGSSGIKGQELVNLAQAEGLYNAVALDGGGSVQVLSDFNLVHPSSDPGGTRNHGDFVVMNGYVMSRSITPWRTVTLDAGFTGSLQWRVVDGTHIELRGDITGDLVQGVYNVATGAIPVGYRPRGGVAIRGAIYLNGYMGMVHILTSGDIGILNRSGEARTQALVNITGPID